MAQFYIKNALQKWHQRKRYSRPCQANCSKVLGWNYGICNSPIIEEIRGLGMITGTEFTNNKSPTDLFPAEWGIGAIFGQECQKRGMLVRVAGDAIMMLPTLIMTPREVGEVDELMRIYGEALKATEVRVAELKSKRN